MPVERISSSTRHSHSIAAKMSDEIGLGLWFDRKSVGLERVQDHAGQRLFIVEITGNRRRGAGTLEHLAQGGAGRKLACFQHQE